MMALIKRNLKIFFRDRTSVFFSLLGVFIIIGLYVLFLGDMMQANMQDIPNIRFVMDSWIMAGLMAVTSITTTMGAFGLMVDDREKNIIKDFTASPLSRLTLTGGYIISTFLIGVVMSVVALIFAEAYIVISGGFLLPIPALLQVLGCILLSVLASSAMVFFITSFFKSQNAFATASTILGTLIGFLTGIYIPIGTLPTAVQWIIKIFPVSHAGSLFRQIMIQEPMRIAFENASSEVVHEFNVEMGVIFTFGDTAFPWIGSVLILVATAILFFGLSSFNLFRKRK